MNIFVLRYMFGFGKKKLHAGLFDNFCSDLNGLFTCFDFTNTQYLLFVLEYFPECIFNSNHQQLVGGYHITSNIARYGNVEAYRSVLKH